MKTTLTLLRSNYSTLFFAADAAIAIVILHEDHIRKSSCQPFWISKYDERKYSFGKFDWRCNRAVHIFIDTSRNLFTDIKRMQFFWQHEWIYRRLHQYWQKIHTKYEFLCASIPHWGFLVFLFKLLPENLFNSIDSYTQRRHTLSFATTDGAALHNGNRLR